VPRSKLLVWACLWGLLAGCAGKIPPQLAGQVAWNLSFPEIRRQPEAYRDRVVGLGGIVASVDALDAAYRVVVNELPLDGTSRHRPAVEQPPRGQFIAVIPTPMFPHDLRPGAEVTVVGEVRGAGRVPEAMGGEEVPLLEGRHVEVWGPSWWPRVLLNLWGGISI
jgi:starvation-inducible outer membrane lipoprotein